MYSPCAVSNKFLQEMDKSLHNRVKGQHRVKKLYEVFPSWCHRSYVEVLELGKVDISRSLDSSSCSRQGVSQKVFVCVCVCKSTVGSSFTPWSMLAFGSSAYSAVSLLSFNSNNKQLQEHI